MENETHVSWRIKSSNTLFLFIWQTSKHPFMEVLIKWQVFSHGIGLNEFSWWGEAMRISKHLFISVLSPFIIAFIQPLSLYSRYLVE